MALIDLVRLHYQATEAGDGDAVFSNFASEFSWTETEGSFNGGTYHGPTAVFEHVFSKIDEMFTAFQFVPSKFIEGENQLVVIGHYLATVDDIHKKVATVHHWKGTPNKIHSFEQITDTATLNGLIS